MKNKLEELKKAIDIINNVFPKNSKSIFIHGVDLNQLPEEWEVEANRTPDGIFLTAKNKNLPDVTLFD